MHGIPWGFSDFELYLASTAARGIWRLILILISNSVFLKLQRNKILTNYQMICVLKANYCQFFVNSDIYSLLTDEKSSRRDVTQIFGREVIFSDPYFFT